MSESIEWQVLARLDHEYSVLDILDDIARSVAPDRWRELSNFVLDAYWSRHGACLTPPVVSTALGELGAVGLKEVRYQQEVLLALGSFEAVRRRFASARVTWPALLAGGLIGADEVAAAEFLTDHLFIQRAILADVRLLTRRCPPHEPVCAYVRAAIACETKRGRPKLWSLRALSLLRDLAWVWDDVERERVEELIALAGGPKALTRALAENRRRADR